MKHRSSTRIAGELALVLLTLSYPAVAFAQQVLGAPRPDAPANLSLEAALYEANMLASTGALSTQALQETLTRQGMTVTADGRVHVEIVGPVGGPAVAEQQITRFEGTLDNVWRHRADAWVPALQLINLARSLPAGYFMLRAAVPSLDAVAGEGPGAIGSDSYRDGGADGTGIVIALIDSDYLGFADAQANGDAPAEDHLTRINYTAHPFEYFSTHGTGCVETIYDHAPGATYRLYCVDSVTDLGVAVDDALSYSADIFSHSMSWYNQGWADDSGDACAAANAAAEGRALLFTSAGNRALEHWQGAYHSGDGDLWHEWSSGDELLQITVAPQGYAVVYLSWDTTFGAKDFDLYLYDSSGSYALAWSTNTGNETFEWTSWFNESLNETVQINIVVIAKYNPYPPQESHEIEVFGSLGWATWDEYDIPASSTTCPSNSTNPNVISVGAVDWSNHTSDNGTDGIIMNYSSHGPSNSMMIIPDLCGPTNTTGFTYPNGFGGTSCATPNNAGAAAAFWSADRWLIASAIRWLMFEKAANWKDWGFPGHDTIYGWGGSHLVSYRPHTLWIARDYGNTGNNRSEPFYTVQAAHDAAVAGGSLRIFLGGDYPEPVLLNKQVHVETVLHPSTLGM